MDLNDLRSLITLAGLCLFLALMAWTWWPGHRAAAEEAALLPFAGEGGPAANGGDGERDE